MSRQTTSPFLNSFCLKMRLPLSLRRGEKRQLKCEKQLFWGEVKIPIKVIAILFCIFLFNTCETKPYVKHKVKFEKVAEHCSAVSQKFEMNSNINGERYEFNKCLPDDYSKERVTSERRGDTVVVKFEKAGNNMKQYEFHIILDIDAYPRYNFLSIDGETYAIVPVSAKN